MRKDGLRNEARMDPGVVLFKTLRDKRSRNPARVYAELPW